jgi:hypothetical protein
VNNGAVESVSKVEGIEMPGLEKWKQPRRTQTMKERHRFLGTIIGAVCLGLVLTGCGKKGGPSTATDSADAANAAKVGVYVN